MPTSPKLWVPNRADAVFSSLKGTVSDNALQAMIARHEEDLRAIEDEVNSIVIPDAGGGSSFSGVGLYLNANFAVTRNTSTPIPWSATFYETGAWWDVGTPTAITIPTTGNIFVSGTHQWQNANAIGDLRRVELYINGSIKRRFDLPAGVTTNFWGVPFSFSLAVTAGDSLTINCQFGDTVNVNRNLLGNGLGLSTQATVYYLGA